MIFSRYFMFEAPAEAFECLRRLRAQFWYAQPPTRPIASRCKILSLVAASWCCRCCRSVDRRSRSHRPLHALESSIGARYGLRVHAPPASCETSL